MKINWCKIFGHKWETTKQNRYFVHIEACCTRCPVTGRMDLDFSDKKDTKYFWVYSDGTQSSKLSLRGLQ